MPILNVQLPADAEVLLRQQAARSGKDINQYLTSLINNASNPSSVTLSTQETALFRVINKGFSPDFWKRLRLLETKLEEETLISSEHQELILMAEEVELAQANRILALAELARLRGIGIDEVMPPIQLVEML